VTDEPRTPAANEAEPPAEAGELGAEGAAPAAGLAAAAAPEARPPGTPADLVVSAAVGSATAVESPTARRDAILIERARAGDLSAFNDIVELHQDFLHSLVVRVVPDRDQADDVTQEAFFRAYRQLAAYRGGSLRSWLARIAMNAALDLQRARRRRPVQPYPELEDDSWQPPSGADTDPEQLITAAERHAAIGDALAGITADQRAAIVLFDVEGFDYAEIAEMTGVSLGTVKSRIHRGRLAMRGLLADRLELFREH
jgi:RNA polymerase sigma-70 factor (ECF subfamily)